MKTIYMYIDTSDDLLLPLAVADGPAELARIAGVRTNNVISSAIHGEKQREREAVSGRKHRGTTKFKFERVRIEEDDECEDLTV